MSGFARKTAETFSDFGVFATWLWTYAIATAPSCTTCVAPARNGLEATADKIPNDSSLAELGPTIAGPQSYEVIRAYPLAKRPSEFDR
jgi:hypothetical protein